MTALNPSGKLRLSRLRPLKGSLQATFQSKTSPLEGLFWLQKGSYSLLSVGIASVTLSNTWILICLYVEVTLTVGVAPKNDMSQLPAEAIHWTNSKTFGKYELFAQQNTPLTLESAAASSLVSSLCHCVLPHLHKQCNPSLPTLHWAKTAVKAERMSLCLVCFSAWLQPATSEGPHLCSQTVVQRPFGGAVSPSSYCKSENVGASICSRSQNGRSNAPGGVLSLAASC